MAKLQQPEPVAFRRSDSFGQRHGEAAGIGNAQSSAKVHGRQSLRAVAVFGAKPCKGHRLRLQAKSPGRFELPKYPADGLAESFQCDARLAGCRPRMERESKLLSDGESRRNLRERRLIEQVSRRKKEFVYIGPNSRNEDNLRARFLRLETEKQARGIKLPSGFASVGSGVVKCAAESAVQLIPIAEVLFCERMRRFDEERRSKEGFLHFRGEHDTLHRNRRPLG